MYCFPESRFLLAVVILSIIFITSLLSVYVTTWLSFHFQRRLHGPVKVPPTVPYVIPFVGSAIGFAIDPRRFISASRYVSNLYASTIQSVYAIFSPHYRQQAGPQAVHGIKMMNTTLYLLYKPKNIAQMWKYKNHHYNAKCHNVRFEDGTWDDPQSSRHVHLGYLRD